MSSHLQPHTADELRRPWRSSPYRFRNFVFAILLLAALCLPEPILAFEAIDGLPLLTTCQSVHHLTPMEANRHAPVHLRAVVTYYEAGDQKYAPVLFVTDRSGSVFVALRTAPAVPLVAGDVVEVTGISSGGDYAPVVAQGEVHVVGRSALPANAPRVEVETMMSGAQEGQWVEVKAVVQSVHTSDTAITLSLAMQGGGVIMARTPIVPDIDYAHLVDAAIVLRGNASPSFNHQGQITGGILSFPGMAALRITRQAPADPFALPVQHPGTLLGYDPDKDLQHRVHIRGAVTLYWPARLLCVEDDGKGMCAQIEQSNPIQPGDLADLAGFPIIGDFTPTLVHATYRPDAGRLTVAAKGITSAQALDGRYDGRLVSIEAKVISEDKVASNPTIVLSSGDSLFTAVLPKALARGTFDTLQVGSRVRLTGICSVQANGKADRTRSGFPVAESFRMLLRSPADIAVLETPSWWNAAHTLRVLALALVLALVALCTVILLSRRVKQQTLVIRAQLAQTAALKEAAENATIAAEYQAAHDELTGSLNRRMIFALLKKEFEAAAVSGSAIGVIMLDLDHFKHVNDTYGHLAGDEILRETVRRVTLAVRSSDVVGRYGGEEFLIVLPHCEKSRLQACAERIRTAIAAEPMQVGDIAIPMTTSVGTAFANFPPHLMLDTLAAADSALYHAKHGGRNRVVLKNLETGQFENFFTNTVGNVA